VLAAEGANRAAARGDDADAFRVAATAVLVTIGVSDAVDGYLARRFHLQTKLGATLDAVADKLAQVVLTSYLTLRTGAAFAPIPWWFMAMLIARDTVLLFGFLSIRARHGRVDTEHQAHGKISSLLLFFLLVAFSSGIPTGVATPLLLGIAAFVAVSTALYVRRGLREYVRGPATSP
jgi:cardiolipin synthase